CTSINGLILKSRIEQRAIKTDPRVLEFAQNETPSTLIIQELNSGKADSFYKNAREELKANNFKEDYGNFLKAIKYRNDIETEIFQKYLISYATKLNRIKNKFFENNHKLIEKENELDKLRDENANQQLKIEQQNKAIEL